MITCVDEKGLVVVIYSFKQSRIFLPATPLHQWLSQANLEKKLNNSWGAFDNTCHASAYKDAAFQFQILSHHKIGLWASVITIPHEYV